MRKVTKNKSGFGCGKTLGIERIKKGDTVLVIGSGAGSDCFRASKKVGEFGKVIGVDSNQDLIEQASRAARKNNCSNVEFRFGFIEDMPIKPESIDLVISHCVINLVPDKLRVYEEIYRVLKKGGKMYISDVVMLRNLSEAEKNDSEFMNDCVKGALFKDNYLKIIEEAGFQIRSLLEDQGVKKYHKAFPLERLKIKI